jgi:hypothetical protein
MNSKVFQSSKDVGNEAAVPRIEHVEAELINVWMLR